MRGREGRDEGWRRVNCGEWPWWALKWAKIMLANCGGMWYDVLTIGGGNMRGSTYRLMWIAMAGERIELGEDFNNFGDLILYVDRLYPYHTSYGIEVTERLSKNQFMPQRSK